MTGSSVTVSLRLTGQEETEALARGCADLAEAGSCFLLSGDLGAGKSTFARAFIRRLTSPDEEVPSPTFTLVQQYGPVSVAGREVEIWHADLYRIGDPDEILELGLDEAFAAAICLVEWPDRLGPFAPTGAVELRLGICEAEAVEDGVRRVRATLPARLRPAFAAAVAAAGLEGEWTE